MRQNDGILADGEIILLIANLEKDFVIHVQRGLTFVPSYLGFSQITNKPCTLTLDLDATLLIYYVDKPRNVCALLSSNFASIAAGAC